MDSTDPLLPSPHGRTIAFYTGKTAANFVLGSALGAALHLTSDNRILPLWADTLAFGICSVLLFGLFDLLGALWRRHTGRRQVPTTLPTVQDRLLAELHRRTQRYESGEITDPAVQMNVAGELVGLRVAVGVAHGYEAATPQCPQEAVRLYGAWLARKDRGGKAVTR